MFGWEFPPHISGGLGTASYGLTRGLSTIPDLDITFVVPKAYGDEDQTKLRIVGAGDVSLDSKYMKFSGLLKDLSYIEVNSNLIPYHSPEEYELLVNKAENEENKLIHTTPGGKLVFSGEYGQNLFEEIANYALVAGQIAAENEHDVIHAHDWLCYPAGMSAKSISG